MDELIGNLDLKNGDVVMDLFDELNKKGIIICMVIYDLCYVGCVKM